MKWFIAVVTMVAGLGSFTMWLGWGRLKTWVECSGWSKLSAEEKAWARDGEAAFDACNHGPDLSWLGHATMRIEWAGQCLITDPVSSKRVKVAPRLFEKPRVDDALPVDAILISHAHMDHLDPATLERLPPSRLLLPKGSERFLSDAVRARHTVVPVRMGVPMVLGDLEIIPVPARHGGWRYPWQRGLFACGYMIRHSGESLYLAGDTAQGAHFESIREAYHPRYAVLPIGAYAPECFLRSRHLNPDEALDAAQQLQAEYVIPYHFGTFRLSLEPVDEPLRRFAAAALVRSQKWFLPVAD